MHYISSEIWILCWMLSSFLILNDFCSAKKYFKQHSLKMWLERFIFFQSAAAEALWRKAKTETKSHVVVLVVVMWDSPLIAEGLLRSLLGLFPVCRSLAPSSWERRPSWKKLNMSLYFSSVIMTGAAVSGNKTTCDLELFDFSPSWCYSFTAIVPFC